MLTEKLMNVALFGAEWVLWLLIGLSVISIALMIERWLFFRRTSIDATGLAAELRKLLANRELDKARARVARHAGALEGDVLIAGLERTVIEGDVATGGRLGARVSEAMLAAKTRGKLPLRRNLAFLATLGNNAPFIGLFGTVLGVIKAFHDLAAKKGQGPEVVMGSLSEALIATGVGLLVALPAVVAFNYFQGKVRQRLAQADALAHDLLADLDPEKDGATRAANVA
jgi:biopolymer transport protein ExbB